MSNYPRVLCLNLKGEYWYAIKRGEKLEEYRLVKEYWQKRIAKDYDEIHLLLGYPKRGDETRLIKRKWNGATKKEITHPHFGDNPVMVFAIDVGEKI